MARDISIIKSDVKEKDLEALRLQYEELFGEQALEDGQPTNDKTLLVMKITYAIYLAECANDETPPNKTIEANATKYFEKAFKSSKSSRKGPKVDRGPGLIKTIVDVCWKYYQAGEHPTIETLAAEVTEAVPNCYKKDPIGRMKVDVRKFNLGEFKYATLSGKIPPKDNPFQLTPSAATTRTRKSKDATEGAEVLAAPSE